MGLPLLKIEENCRFSADFLSLKTNKERITYEQ